MLSRIFKCLIRPSYSLRKQLLLTFGRASIATILLLVLVACLSSIQTGNIVKDQSGDLLRQQIKDRLSSNSRYVAEAFEGYLDGMHGTVQIISELVRDRIVGYPNAGWETDQYVPFRDMITNRNRYPLQSSSLISLDWNVTPNVNPSNAAEHFPGRPSLLQITTPMASTPTYFFQGSCDPDENNVTSPKYFPNCTEANNNINTGGSVRPTESHGALYEKAADIGVLLKAVFEAQYDISLAGFYFKNQGAGSIVSYPGHIWGTLNEPYVSSGCKWMLQNTNPYTNRSFATVQEVARCQRSGTKVSNREYNVLEREWFKEIALNSSRGVVWSLPISSRGPSPLVFVGEAVFDRMTGEFIGCSALTLVVEAISDMLMQKKLYDSSDLAVIRYSDNAVLVDTHSRSVRPSNITETDLIPEEILDELRRNVDYGKKWSPEEIKNNTVEDSERIYTAHPVPKPPDKYDPLYKPEWLVIQAISNEVFADAEKIDDEVDSQVRRLCVLSVTCGVVGLIFIFGVLIVVSKGLTQPLLWMNKVASSIINHSDGDVLDDIRRTDHEKVSIGASYGKSTKSSCFNFIPRTEIDDLVAEFRAMIEGFSGDGAASLAEPHKLEIANHITWQSDYQKLYSYSAEAAVRKSVRLSSRAGHSVNGQLTTLQDPEQAEEDIPNERVDRFSGDASGQNQTACIVPAPAKKNIGRNIVPNISRQSKKKDACMTSPRTYRSALFWWILILIVAPLVFTSVCICMILSEKITRVVESMVSTAELQSRKLELNALVSATKLKATQAHSEISQIIRNLHILTRLAGWLLFDGITRSDSFTFVTQATQECSRSGSGNNRYPIPENNLCDFLLDKYKAPCACDWNDVVAENCFSDYNISDTRYLQNGFFFLQKRDYEKTTGNRSIARTFGPGVDDSPENTLWWDNVNELPGAEKGSNASGSETAYDRLRVSSAAAVVEAALYNYAKPVQKWVQKEVISTFMGFEADGMGTGFAGCSHFGFALAASFKSTKENRASEIAPLICPLGKFGYDPRCRDWYANGKRLYKEDNRPVYISAPYKLAVDDRFATAATAAVANPKSGEYIGQTMIDFVPQGLIGLFDGLDNPVAFVLGGEKNEVVIGPGQEQWEPHVIGDLLFTHEPSNSVFRSEFERGLFEQMAQGRNGTGDFFRTTQDGGKETFTLAYEPVNASVLQPHDPSDFSRGCAIQDIRAYSVGIALPEDSFKKPWATIADDVNEELGRLQYIYITIITFVTFVFAAVSCKITEFVATPMITLLQVLRMINAYNDDDVPSLKGGSREVNQVYNSFAKLYRIIRVSNVAFFSGNLTWAQKIMTDALILFQKIGDEKAVGIVSNNIGNAFHAMCSEARYESDCCRMIDSICTVKEAVRYYDRSISIAEAQLANATDEEQSADFAQQLADRLFNRSLCLLLVAGEGCAPEDARERALNDLRKTKQLDYDIKDFWLKRKLLLKNSAVYFSRLVLRTLGLLDFYGDEEVRSIWDASDLVQQGDQLLFAAWDQPSVPLFDEVSKVGRLQQLESLAMRLDLCKGRLLYAARLAMRMFAEDEYLIECAFMMAGTVLLQLARSTDVVGTFSPSTKSSLRNDLRKMLRTCKLTNLDVGKTLVFAIELSKKWEGQPLLEKLNELSLKLYDDCVLQDDNFGLAAYATDGDMNIPICVKADNEGRQRTSLDIAMCSISGEMCASFPYAIQMLVDSSVTMEFDSFILYILDGTSWDFNTHSSMKLQVDRMNQDRETKVHVFVLGLDVESEYIREECKAMCQGSKTSMYFDVNLENAVETFDHISALIRGQVFRHNCSLALVMEKI